MYAEKANTKARYVQALEHMTFEFVRVSVDNNELVSLLSKISEMTDIVQIRNAIKEAVTWIPQDK